jgi:hypothetical protein
VSVTVGAGVVPVTDTEAEAWVVPPAPVQLSEYVAFAVNAPVPWVPDVALLPFQLPEAVHDVALVEDQVNVLPAPLLTEVGVAVSVTVGAGVVLVTATDVLACAEPPAPVQLRVYEALAFKLPVDSLPETAFAPLQLPVAEHAVALVLDQVRVLAAPALTDTGLADNVTVGAGLFPPPEEEAASPPPPQAVRKLTNTSTEIRRTAFMAAIIRKRGARRVSSALGDAVLVRAPSPSSRVVIPRSRRTLPL